MEGLTMNPDNPEFGNRKFEGIVEEKNKNGLSKDPYKLPSIDELPPLELPKKEFKPLDIKELPPL